MLGSLQEAEFDMTGRVSVLQLVQGALGACACAMPIDYKQAHFLVNSDGESLLSHNLGALKNQGRVASAIKDAVAHVINRTGNV